MQHTINKPIALILSFAALVIVIAALKAAKVLIVPLLLAVFIAIICLPLLQRLLRWQLPSAIAVLIVTLLMITLLLLSAAFLGASISDFSRQLPVYQERLQQQTLIFAHWLESFGISISGSYLLQLLDPSVAMKLAGSLLASLGNALTNTLFIVLTVIFLLFEFIALPHKWALIAEHAPSTRYIERFLESVNQYLVIKTAVSALTGILVSIYLSIIGLDYPLLWGFLAFLFNFVPNIGSIIAAIPAVLLALVQLSLGDAAYVGLGYLLINIVMGNAIEPRFMGRGVGLSTLVVFLSLVFWGWVLGPVGMLLSIPLTMIVKLALEANEQTTWIAVLLGPDIEPSLQQENSDKA